MAFRRQLSVAELRIVEENLKKFMNETRILEMEQYIQHGTTTVFEHVVSVSIMALRLSAFFSVKSENISMTRGALLHDYFLYDWHKCKLYQLHGYHHPKIALENAKKVVELNEVEKDVIVHHMFPLTLPPPKTKEGFIVSCADKICSLFETLKLNERKNSKEKIKRRSEWIQHLKSQ